MKEKIAFLWDESFLWGLMAYESLTKNGLPFELIRCEDIRQKGLSKYAMLFVPGGWASNKLKALGNIGIKEIKRFVESGGSYLGICGGAGLATLDGIGLLEIKRKQTKDRVPSFSGKIRLRINEHPIWKGLGKKDSSLSSKGATSYIFHVWWPSQFIVQNKEIKVLATYDEAMPDAFSSDFCVGDISNSGHKWAELERIYEINLDPARLIDETAVVEGSYGKGKVILSLVHFDTPDDNEGHAVLKNMWEYLLNSPIDDCLTNSDENITPLTISETENLKIIAELFEATKELIRLGERNFLWFQRNSMLFQWRRGVRGLEYCNLYALIKKIAEISNFNNKNSYQILKKHESKLIKIRESFFSFYSKAKQLLLMERLAMLNGHITYEKCNDNKLQSLRIELFSASKSYGGIYKKLINDIDELLFDLIRKVRE